MHVGRVLNLGLKPNQIIPALLEVQNSGPQAAFYLEKLENLYNKAAIEQICELAMFEEEKYPIARQIVLDKNYVPREGAKQALFYYLTEQWKKYEGLHAQYKVGMEHIYRRLSPEIQRKVASFGRKVGRSDLVQQLKAKKVAYQSGAEQLMLDSLAAQGNWLELWQLIAEWPPVWGCQALQKLAKAGWQPENEAEQTCFRNLLTLDQNCSNETAINFGKLQLQRNYFLESQEREESFTSPVINSQTGLIAALLHEKEQIGFYSATNGNLIGVVDYPKREDFSLKPFELVYSADGAYLATSSLAGSITISIINIKRKTIINQLDFKVLSLYKLNLAFFPDNRLLVYGEHQNKKFSYRVYDIFSGALLEVLDGPPTIGVKDIVISPNGLFLAGRDVCETLWIWSIPEKRLLLSLNDLPLAAFFSRRILQFSPDSLQLAFTTLEAIVVMDLQTGQIIQEIKTGGYYCIYYVAFSPDGQILISAQSDTREVKFWRLADGELLDTIPLRNSYLVDLVFNFEGNNICLLDGLCQLHIWREEFRALLERPLKENRPADLEQLERRLLDTDVAQETRAWLEFTVALLKWRWRHAISVEDAPQIEAAPTDIELENQD